MKPTRTGPPSRPPAKKPQAFNLEEALILDQRGCDAAPVFVPGYLARKLRPHQQQGVQFLYNVCPCTTLQTLHVALPGHCCP
jgi:hypothetical protein